MRDPAGTAVRFQGIDRVSISACGTAYYAGWSPSTGSSASRACRSTSISPRNSAIARRRSPGGLACRRLAVGRDRRHAGLAALREGAGAARRWRRQRPTSTIARESDVVLPTLAGPEIGVASTKAFTCQLAALACLASPPAGRAAPTRTMKAAGARADRGAAPDGEALRSSREIERWPRSLEGAATCSISAAAPASRWRSKARSS
jgi:glutamine---fructose-6-phosphate transaminase (isomerizing)